MTLAAMTGLVQAGELAVGESIPSIKAKNHDNKPIDLEAVSQQGWMLVYFYPQSSTPGCTNQACSLRDSFTQLTQRGVQIYGVSNDRMSQQKKFVEDYQLPFDLLPDKSKRIIHSFGVPSSLGFAKRQAYLFKDGVLVWRDLKASTHQQAADVLAQSERLSSLSIP